MGCLMRVAIRGKVCTELLQLDTGRHHLHSKEAATGQSALFTAKKASPSLHVCAWLWEKTKLWEEAVVDLASAAPKFLQNVCSGPQQSLQQEWRVAKNLGPEFKAVELALSGALLPTLFGCDCGSDGPWHDISCLPMKWAGLAIPNPASAAEVNCEVSTLICSHVLATFGAVEAL